MYDFSWLLWSEISGQKKYLIKMSIKQFCEKCLLHDRNQHINNALGKTSSSEKLYSSF